MKNAQLSILCACVLIAPMFPVAWEEWKIAKQEATDAARVKAQDDWDGLKRKLEYLHKAAAALRKSGDVAEFTRELNLCKDGVRRYLDENPKSSITQEDGRTLIPAIEAAFISPSAESAQAMQAEIERVAWKRGFSDELK